MNPIEQEAVYEEAPIVVEEFVVSDSKVGLGVILFMAAFVGLWGVACLISGLATMPGLKEAAKTLINAFIGV